MRTARRDDLREFLRNEGVETLVHWPKPMWEHKGLSLVDPGLPETERICREVISLPMSAETTDEDVALTVAIPTLGQKDHYAEFLRELNIRKHLLMSSPDNLTLKDMLGDESREL